MVMADAGIDACIVQDFGVASYLKKSIPTMSLHASTQMTIHTVGGLKTAADMGFSRIVAAGNFQKKVYQNCVQPDVIPIRKWKCLYTEHIVCLFQDSVLCLLVWAEEARIAVPARSLADCLFQLQNRLLMRFLYAICV